MPLFLTDGFREYLTALVTHYGEWMQPERGQAKGPKPKPRWMPLPQLLYAQVVKSYRRRRITGVKHRVVFGTRETIDQILAKHGWKINTAFIERLNLDFRQHVAAIGRRVNTLCKHEAGLRQQLAVFQAYHNFCLPHASLRLSLPDLMDTVEAGKRWQPRTPAMAAGLTDRVWSLREVLMFHTPTARNLLRRLARSPLQLPAWRINTTRRSRNAKSAAKGAVRRRQSRLKKRRAIVW